jgi:hypothetical protein
MFIEGLALRKPPVPDRRHLRQARSLAAAHRWPTFGYGTVYAIVAAVDPGLKVMAHQASSAGQPHGHGKIERLIGTFTIMKLPHLPGYAPVGTPDRGAPQEHWESGAFIPACPTPSSGSSVLARMFAEGHAPTPHAGGYMVMREGGTGREWPVYQPAASGRDCRMTALATGRMVHCRHW